MRIADEKVNPFKSHESHKNCFQKVVKLDCKATVSSTAVAGPKDKPPKISMELALEKKPTDRARTPCCASYGTTMGLSG